MTVVLVTHERALADRYATRQIFLADGKLSDHPVIAHETAEVAR
jgi:predicted ABC-type transport system involved in lysophospholipase L1 biosynthesis ATPase subunit